MRLALLVTVALLLGAAATATASEPPQARNIDVCHLTPWLPWCHGDSGEDCEHVGHHHHCHPGGGGSGGGGGTPGGGGGGGGTPGGGGGGGGGTPGGGGGGGGTPGGGTPGGTTPPGATPAPGAFGVLAADTAAPTFLANPRLYPRRFRAARRGPSLAVTVGTTITYRLSEPARVTFTVQKYRHLSRICRRKLRARSSRHRTGTRCRRWISLKGRFAKASIAGPNSVRFTGRLKGRALRPGAYRLVIRARDSAGNVTRPRRPAFRIIR